MHKHDKHHKHKLDLNMNHLDSEEIKTKHHELLGQQLKHIEHEFHEHIHRHAQEHEFGHRYI